MRVASAVLLSCVVLAGAPTSGKTAALQAVAQKLGYPVLVRPSFVLGGRAMQIVYTDAELQHYMRFAVEASPDGATVRAAYDSKTIGLVSLVGRYEGTNTTFGNSFTLPDFGVLDASLSRGIIAGLDGFVSVENVFDRAYTVSLAGTATAPIITVGLPRTLRIGLEVYRH